MPKSNVFQKLRKVNKPATCACRFIVVQKRDDKIYPKKKQRFELLAISIEDARDFAIFLKTFKHVKSTHIFKLST